jgi:hypothetical protein
MDTSMTHPTIATAPRVLMMPATLATMAVLATGLTACGAEATTAGHSHSHAHAAVEAVTEHKTAASEAALHAAMRLLWVQHMEWTYATIAAFAADTPGLSATLDRLLANQSDIGEAIKPFYGDEAGNALTELLEAHINGAVPILVSAKAGNTDDLNKAVAAWYANATPIADFLAAANPAWPEADLEDMMKGHIDQTLDYATAQLQGRYADSITSYGKAEAHMQEMADMLSAGIVEQFPKRFRK